MTTPKHTIKLTDHFDRVFVLNLDHRTDRWENFQQHAADRGVSGFERYRAVHGDSCPHPHFWRAGNGAWGCLMSHLRVVQDCLMDGVRNYLVLEDDVVFAPNFAERLPVLVNTLSGLSWDMFYLGGQHLYIESHPPYPFREGIVRGVNINRTHAFAVNGPFMERFQQHITHFPDYIARHVQPKAATENQQEVAEWFPHIDHQLGVLHERKDSVILAADPWLCGQAASTSSVNGRKQDEQWWHDKGWYR